jgi:adenine-specific DNA-methyltransferase
LPTNYWPYAETGHTDEAKKELISIFGGKSPFDTPKPTRLLEFVLKIAADKNAVIFDSFAGSGTTAHAVLNMNKADGGSRKFILVEMMDYADSITAERVKRVINGYGEDKKAVDGTGGNFSYYELGEALMIGDVLNEDVGVEKIREYVYFTDTKSHLPEPHADEPYFMGVHVNSAYYFYYEREAVTTLNREFLHTIKTKADAYVTYADLCTLSEEELERYHITFKKIPRDITKL